MFTCPPIINTVIALCASGIASALIAFGLISVLVHGTKLAGVLCVAACIYIASKLCPTYHQRWQDRQEERRRKEEENM